MMSGKKRPVSVEDLLRLKRAERPAADFWSDFDRQLRTKQLAALVGKRPWWREVTFSFLFGALRKYHLPLGAVAVVAVTVVSVQLNQSEAPVPVAARGESGAPTGPVLAVVAEAGTRAVASSAIEMSVATPPEEGQEAEVAAPLDQSTLGAASSYLPALGVGLGQRVAETSGSGLRYAEPALISSIATETLMARTLLHASSRLEVPAMPARPTVEPLQQITPPGERRGARILTAMVSMASVEHAMRTTERAASRLSEEQLYEQIHRFGARGAGVNLKF